MHYTHVDARDLVRSFYLSSAIGERRHNGHELTNPNIGTISIVQVLNVLVHLSRRCYAHHPELGDFRERWSRVLVKRMCRGKAVDDNRACQQDVKDGERGQKGNPGGK